MSVIGHVAQWVGAVALAVAVAPSVDPALPGGWGAALALGCASGVALFAALARAPVPAGVLAPGRRRRALARCLVLSGRSAYEEAIWRALLLGSLATVLGRLGALVAATALFAAAHLPRQGRRAAVHVLTGAVFGAVYLASGTLTASIAAHAVYNMLVGLALLDRAPVLFGQSTARRAAPRIERDRRRPAVDRTPPPNTMPGTPAARLDSVRRTFGETVALDGLSLELRTGEVLALLGPNGAGKSTAVAVMLGLRRPDSGIAELFGRDPRSPAAKRRIGVVLQDASFPWTLPVREVVELVRAHYSDPRPAAWLLESVGLASCAHRQTGGLSGGQRRRLALGLALAGRPDALFLDEPTAGIDVDGRRALWEVLGDFVAAGGAILLTTHRLDEAEAVATRVVVLAGGRVIREGTVGELRSEGGLARVRLRTPRLPALPASLAVDSRGDRHTIYTDSSDALVAELVASGAPFFELEVTRASLEDAYVALTGAER